MDSLYDESGVMCYTYGNMGEVTQETRIYALPFLSQPIALATQFTYDSWGRIQSITYPDNEVVSYAYDLGGQLQSITNNSSYTYLDNVTYDRFGAKVSQKYGNGITTDYSYNNVTRRLSTITTLNGNSQISTFAYTYDLVGNVTQVTSSCPWLNSQTFSETFTYDAADQLTAATESQSQSYQLAVTYGNWGKINSYSLAQADLQNNTTQSEIQSYTYPAANSLQNSQTLFAPEQRTITDANNNMATETLSFGINGSLRKREVQAQPQTSYTEYYLFNGAANLKAYSNNGLDFAYYGYNATNTRTYKLNFLNANSWVNGQLVSLLFLCSPKEKKQKERAFAAVEKNPVHNARQLAERRYPLRSHRSAPLPCYGRRIFFITPQVCDMTLTTREIQRLQQWQDATLSSEVPPCNLLFSIAYGQVCLRSAKMMQASLLHSLRANSLCFVSFFFSGRRKKERNEGKNFYYHTNHLGSTAFVTDQNQNITQGFLYAPFGEITTEYNSNFGSDIIPKYSFNAKELDEETGMYYYEARYYKPPVFTSRDPMMDQKPWLTPYHYCSNNPVGRLDPSGMLDDEWEYNMGTQRWTWRSSKGRDIGVDIVHVTSGNGNSMGSYVCENGLSSCNCYGNVTDYMGFHMESFRIIDGNNSASFTYSISATPLNENTTSDSKWMNCIGEVALGTSIETTMIEEAAKSASNVSKAAKEVEAEKVFSKVSKLAKWVGRDSTVVGVVGDGYDLYNATTTSGMWHAGINITMDIIGFFPPFGTAASIAWGLFDLSYGDRIFKE